MVYCLSAFINQTVIMISAASTVLTNQITEIHSIVTYYCILGSLVHHCFQCSNDHSNIERLAILSPLTNTMQPPQGPKFPYTTFHLFKELLIVPFL